MLDFEEDDSDSECSTGSGKRFRTTITQQQLQRLLVEYNKAPKPSRETRKRLSRELRLDYRVIQVWFQNRRAKSKKRSPRDERHSRTQQNDVDLHRTYLYSCVHCIRIPREICKLTRYVNLHMVWFVSPVLLQTYHGIPLSIRLHVVRIPKKYVLITDLNDFCYNNV